MMCGDVIFEGWGGFVFAGFDFDGDDAASVLQHEVDLCAAFRIISWGDVELSLQLLQDIVFCEWAFELKGFAEQNGAVVYAGHCFQEACIKQEQFEMLELVVGF